MMELDNEIYGQDESIGLNNHRDSKQLIRAKIRAKIAINADELKFFRRLHVLLQALEQPAPLDPE